MIFQRKHTAYLSAAALAVAIALPLLPVRAQEDNGPDLPPGPREEMRREVLMELDLSDEQLQEIRALREEARANHRERRQELRQEQQALQELLGGTASEDEVRSQFEQVQALRQELASDQFENIMAMREILEPDQRSLLVENLGRRRDGWRRQMRGWRRRHHRGPAFEEGLAPLEEDF